MYHSTLLLDGWNLRVKFIALWQQDSYSKLGNKEPPNLRGLKQLRCISCSCYMPLEGWPGPPLTHSSDLGHGRPSSSGRGKERAWWSRHSLLKLLLEVTRHFCYYFIGKASHVATHNVKGRRPCVWKGNQQECLWAEWWLWQVGSFWLHLPGIRGFPSH